MASLACLGRHRDVSGHPGRQADPSSGCGAATTLSTYGSELSVAARHLGGDFGNDVPMLGNFAVVDPEEIEERRGLTT